MGLWDQKKVLDYLELEYRQLVVSCQMWVLETKLWVLWKNGRHPSPLSHLFRADAQASFPAIIP